MNAFLKSVIIGATALSLTFTVSAQMGGGMGGMGGPSGGSDIALSKIFGDIKAFSAKADVVIKGGGADATMEMDFALLDGKVRSEIDMAKMKSSQMPAGMGDQLKQMGMDKMVSITDPQKRIIILIYPGLKSYVEMPVPRDQAEMIEKEPKIEKKELGKETVDGHPCKKSQVTITDAKGSKHEALLWTADDLKDFPIKIQMNQNGTDVTMLYKNIKTTKPDAKLFEMPDGYTKYDSIQNMMMQGAMKMMMK